MTVVRITDELAIQAPAKAVWEAVRDPATHARWHPFLTRIQGVHALGEVRRCTVQARGLEGSTEERCTVFEEGRRIRWAIEKDTTGFSSMVTGWTAGFDVRPDGASVRVRAESSFEPRSLAVRLLRPLVARKFHAAQRSILESLRAHVERERA